MGRGTARHVDADPGWVQRRFRELEARVNALQVGKLSNVPGSAVTINQILTDPYGSLQFINTDEFTATADDTQVAGNLTAQPIAGSLHVYQNGVALLPAEWLLAGRYLLVAPSADVIIHAGDVFSMAYAVDHATTVTATPAVTVVGVAQASGPISSLALPADTQAGDLIVAAVTFYNSGSVGDSRVTLDKAFSGQFVPMADVYTGTDDGSGAPLACSLYGGQDVATVIVLRGGTILDQGGGSGVGLYDHDNTGAITNPATAPTLSSAAYALAVVVQRNNLTASGITSAGSYADEVTIAVTPSAALIGFWESGGPATASPADTFTFTGTLDAWGVAVYQIEATS